MLSCDGLSSAAYGTEEILRALLPFFGLAAFSLVLPMTLLILFGVVLVVLSYREVVSVYTRAGGSYVVARENFGPRVAQVAAVALLIDGIILLTALSLALMLVAGATVDALIAFYAIGVFTGLAMAGFGMARYHLRTREPGWRRRLVINAAGGTYTALVVVLFAVVKFTEGAWLIVIIFPVLVYTLIRLNRQYGKEAVILEDLGDDLHPHTPNYSRRVVLLLVDSYDPDRRLGHAAAELAASGARWPPSSPSTSGTRSRRSTRGGRAGVTGCAAWSASAPTAVPP